MAATAKRTAASSASRGRAPSPRSSALILENACSIGVLSGGRQEQQLTVTRRNRRADARGFVPTQGIQNDELAGPQRRAQDLLDVALERRCVHRALDRPRGLEACGRPRRHQRRVLAVMARHRAHRPLVVRRPAIEARQGRVGAALVDKDELLWIARGDSFAPGRPRLLVALAGCQCLF